MKQLPWFMSKVGLNVVGSHNSEPITIMNVAHAHRLFSQQATGATFNDYIAPVEVADTEKDNHKKSKPKHNKK